MMQNFNLAKPILATAGQYPDRVAFRLRDSTIRYGRFHQMVLSFAWRMRELGVERGSRVCITGDGPVLQVCTVLGCALLGCSWVYGLKAVVGNEKKLGITHVVHTDNQPPQSTGNVFPIDQSWFSPRPAGEGDFEGFQSPDSICLVTHSSGTTGSMKAFSISALAQFRRFAENPSDYFHAVPPVMCSLMPFLSVYGMQFVFKTLMLGGTVVKSNDLEFMHAANVTTVLGSPSQYMPLCENFAPLAKKIPCAEIGGARCSDRFFDVLFERFEMIQYAFGSSELGRISFNRFGPGPADRGSVGKPIASAQVQIVDADDRPVPPMMVGTLRTRSHAPLSGYIGEDPGAFRDGWFYSGDTGYLSNDGALTVLGRLDDVLNIAGVKLDANAIDDVIAATEGVKEGVGFAQPGFSPAEELAVLIVPNNDIEAKAIAERVRTNLLAKFGKRGAAQRIYVAAEIPKNENGKIARHSLVKFVEKSLPF